MIIVLEGCMGSGKTSVAREITSLCGGRIVRPFRDPGQYIHAPVDGTVDVSAPDPGGSYALMGRLGVPTNTWHEDVYVAEMLYQIHQVPCPRGDGHVNILLDRSLISGLAWNRLDRTAGRPRLSPGAEVELIGWWSERMTALDATLCMLRVAPDIAARRCREAGRFSGPISDISQEADAILDVASHVRGVRSMMANTGPHGMFDARMVAREVIAKAVCQP